MMEGEEVTIYGSNGTLRVLRSTGDIISRTGYDYIERVDPETIGAGDEIDILNVGYFHSKGHTSPEKIIC